MATIYWTGGAGDGDWVTAGNWSGGAAPVNGDVVYIDRTTDNITLNLDQSAVTLDGLFITSEFEGTIGNGLDETDEFLQIAVDGNNGNVVIGEGDGNNSQRLNLDLGNTVCNIDIRNTQTTGLDSPKSPVRIKCNNSSNVIQINGDASNVSFNDDPSLSVQALGTITVFETNNAYIGPGSTYTELNVISGTVLVAEAQGSNQIQGGTVTFEGSTAISEIIQTDGTVINNSTGTVTTYTGRGGILDLQQSAFARTITTLTKSPDFTLLYDDSVTITNDNLDTDFKQLTIAVTN